MWFRRRKGASGQEVAEPVWRRVEARLPFLARLSAEDHDRLRDLALQLLEEKEMYGANDLQLTNEIRLSIALQASLPILNLGLDYYSGWVGIVVYPGDFVVPRKIADEHGVVHEYDDFLAGEAWQGGPVILSWSERGQDLDGANVVIHEFVHKIDMQNGEPDGIPPLHANMERRAWAEAFSSAYEDLSRRVDAGEETAIDPYASQDPAEFFAVVSETFFEAPDVLIDEYPAVYEQLRQFYRQDPG